VEDDSLRFDEDQTTVNLGELLEFDEIDESETDAELYQLMSRVQAARFTGS